jgi:hypothetical protein
MAKRSPSNLCFRGRRPCKRAFVAAFDKSERAGKLLRPESGDGRIKWSVIRLVVSGLLNCMRRLNGIELAMLVLATIFILTGLFSIIHPSAHLIFQSSARNFFVSAGYISKERVRTYGLLSVVLGAGMVGMVVYRRRK